MLRLNDAFVLSRPEKLLSAKIVKKHHRLLSAILQQAVYWQLIPDNPARRVQPPKTKRYDAKYLDEIQCGRLLEMIENQPMQEKTMAKLLVFSGMRKESSAGLSGKILITTKT